MELYDEALIANQDEERYLSALKKDIEEFKEKKRTIVSYVPSSSVDVKPSRKTVMTGRALTRWQEP